MAEKTDVWQGTLALMVLKTLQAMGPQHGYGLARRIEQTSGDRLQLNYGTLYPALLRLEQEGFIRSRWGVSDNNRKAKFYELTKAGQRQSTEGCSRVGTDDRDSGALSVSNGGVVMRRLRALWVQVEELLSGSRENDEFDAELESHIAMHIEDGVRSGLSPEEARRQALIRLGGVEQTRQTYRERRTLPWLENLVRDVRYALRGFRRNPVFTITAVATLALGIGATTAVFSVVDRILFRSLPYAHGDRLVSVGLTAPIIPEEFMLGGSYFVWRDNQKPFDAFTSETGVDECDLTEHNPARLQCASVEANFSANAWDLADSGAQFSSGRRPSERTQGRPDFLCFVAFSFRSRSQAS